MLKDKLVMIAFYPLYLLLFISMLNFYGGTKSGMVINGVEEIITLPFRI